MFIAGLLVGAMYATVMLLLIGRSWDRQQTVCVLAEMDMADRTVRARSRGQLPKTSELVQ